MAQGGPVGLNDPLDHPANQDRIGATRFVLLDHRQSRLERRAIGRALAAPDRFLPRGRKAGGEIAWLDNGNADAGAAQLHPQRFTVALESEFGGAIHALERNGDQARDGADDDDVGALAGAKMG